MALPDFSSFAHVEGPYQTILLAGIVFGIELELLRSYKISSGWGGAVEVSCCLLLSPLTSGMLSCSL